MHLGKRQMQRVSAGATRMHLECTGPSATRIPERGQMHAVAAVLLQHIRSTSKMHGAERGAIAHGGAHSALEGCFCKFSS